MQILNIVLFAVVAAFCAWELLYAVVWEVPNGFLEFHHDPIGAATVGLYLVVLAWAGNHAVHAMRESGVIGRPKSD